MAAICPPSKMQVSDRHEGRVDIRNINTELSHGPAFLQGGHEFPVQRIHHNHVMVLPKHPPGREAQGVAVDDFVVITAAFIPSFFNFSAVFKASATIIPFAIKVISEPSFNKFPFPISNVEPFS